MEQAARKLEVQYRNRKSLLNELKIHNYSEEEFYGRNYEEYLIMIQDTCDKIDNRMQILQEESLEAIDSRISFLWRRIDALEEALNKD